MSVEMFINRLKNDTDYALALSKADKEAEAVLLAEYGLTSEELTAEMSAMVDAPRELNDAELDDVSGGLMLGSLLGAGAGAIVGGMGAISVGSIGVVVGGFPAGSLGAVAGKKGAHSQFGEKSNSGGTLGGSVVLSGGTGSVAGAFASLFVPIV